MNPSTKLFVLCSLITNVLLSALVVIMIMFAMGTIEMKVITQSMFELSQDMGKDMKEMKYHLTQSLPTAQIRPLLSSANHLTSMYEAYPNAYAKAAQFLSEIENNNFSPGMGLFLSNLETLSTTLTASVNEELMHNINVMIGNIVNFTSAGFQIENSLLQNHEVKIKF
jgi:hypothetical protein